MVQIAGHDVAMVGNVSMDTITLDVTGLPDDILAEGHWWICCQIS
jgi:alanine racemase